MDRKMPPLKKGRRFSRGGKKATIAEDASTLLGEIEKVKTSVFNMKPDPNLSAVENFFTSRMRMDASGCHFAKGDDKVWISPDDPDPTLEKRFFEFRVGRVDEFKLCPEFSEFELGASDEDETEDNASAASGSGTSGQKSSKVKNKRLNVWCPDFSDFDVVAHDPAANETKTTPDNATAAKKGQECGDDGIPLHGVEPTSE